MLDLERPHCFPRQNQPMFEKAPGLDDLTIHPTYLEEGAGLTTTEAKKLWSEKTEEEFSRFCDLIYNGLVVPSVSDTLDEIADSDEWFGIDETDTVNQAFAKVQKYSSDRIQAKLKRIGDAVLDAHKTGVCSTSFDNPKTCALVHAAMDPQEGKMLCVIHDQMIKRMFSQIWEKSKDYYARLYEVAVFAVREMFCDNHYDMVEALFNVGFYTYQESMEEFADENDQCPYDNAYDAFRTAVSLSCVKLDSYLRLIARYTHNRTRVPLSIPKPWRTVVEFLRKDCQAFMQCIDLLQKPVWAWIRLSHPANLLLTEAYPDAQRYLLEKTISSVFSEELESLETDCLFNPDFII